MKHLKLFVILFFLTSLCVFPAIWANGTEETYEGNDGGSSYDGKHNASLSIRELVIRGAGYFLKSRADFQNLLYHIE
ncbi:MAG: hypothetical protein GY940_01700, partial [bacterium]|nr:hypothetical protein [bacterium]